MICCATHLPYHLQKYRIICYTKKNHGLRNFQKRIPHRAKAKSSKSSSATIGFEQQIWDAVCELWGHIPAADYRKIFTGLIFLKYISTAFEKKYNELVQEGDGFEDDPDAYRVETIFFVPKEARWAEITKATHTPEIGTILDKAMIAIETDNKSLKGVLLFQKNVKKRLTREQLPALA